jgi:EAL domain-containing protein (putative c-di-GMP-specific phosphodiesterase class I)
LNYLKTLPIHALKIDKSFICDTPRHEGDCAIAKSIISLASNLNLDVVAEGVETAEQLAFLQENGCSVIQGFYFSKPLDINAFTAYLNVPQVKGKRVLLG